MNLKRLWDTENKKTVRAIPTWDPHKKLQVWTDDDGSHLYVYANSKYVELNTANVSVSEYWPTVWKELDDETVGYYLTNEPTDLYNWDEGDEVAYTFKDYNWTVLKTWKVDEGETPTPPANPTRAATAQYTYTFAGWNPTVWPISKKATYTATYTATVNKYTVTWKDGDDTTIETDANVEYWTTPTYDGETPTKTATAQYTYTWDEGWTPAVAPVTGNATYTATFTATVNKYTVAATSNDTDLWTVSPASVANVEYGTALTVADNVITVGTWESAPTITATAGEGWEFVSWWTVPATVTGNTSVEATFEAQLMTYEELAALGTSTAILEELNTNDEGYYTSLTADDHTFETTTEWATMAMIVSEKWETYETTTPLLVDGNTFLYLVSGEMEGFELQTWYAVPYSEWE